jgi:hypothetical protein
MENLSYELKIAYTDNSGANVVVYKKICEDGLEIKSIQVGDVCITEETINGRVLSGRFDDKKTVCGYRYNYEKDNEEYLVNLNNNVPLSKAVGLINDTKMSSAFLSAKMAFVSIARNDYRVFAIKNGAINVDKIASAENSQAESYSYQESLVLSKEDGDETFVEISKTHSLQINDASIAETSQNYDDAKEKLSELAMVVDKNPSSRQELVKTKAATPAEPTL